MQLTFVTCTSIVLFLCNTGSPTPIPAQLADQHQDVFAEANKPVGALTVPIEKDTVDADGYSDKTWSALTGQYPSSSTPTASPSPSPSEASRAKRQLLLVGSPYDYYDPYTCLYYPYYCDGYGSGGYYGGYSGIGLVGGRGFRRRPFGGSQGLWVGGRPGGRWGGGGGGFRGGGGFARGGAFRGGGASIGIGIGRGGGGFARGGAFRGGGAHIGIGGGRGGGRGGGGRGGGGRGGGGRGGHG